MKKLILYLLLATGVVFWTCTTDDVAGTGHDGEAKVTGCIVDANGNGIVDLKVELLPSDFNPAFTQSQRDVEGLTTITDENGNYTFNDAPSGSYTLYAIYEDYQNSISDLKVVFHPGIEISDTDIELHSDMVKQPGGILICLPDSLIIQSGFLFIPGTYFYSQIDSSNVIKLRAPPGDVNVLFYDPDSPQMDSIVQLLTNVSVDEGVYTTFLDTGCIAIPNAPEGPVTTSTNESSVYTTQGAFFISDSGESTSTSIEYRFSWGDGGISSWSDSGFGSHAWNKTGVFPVQAQARHLSADTTLSLWSDTLWVTVVDSVGDTLLPSLDKPVGPKQIKVGYQVEYFAEDKRISLTLLPDSSEVFEYRFDWGDGGNSVWSESRYAKHAWFVTGAYNVRAQVRLLHDNQVIKTSNWSIPLQVFAVDDTTNDTDVVTIPEIFSGDTVIPVNFKGVYNTFGSVCLNGGSVQYRFDWGDGTYSDWKDGQYTVDSVTTSGDTIQVVIDTGVLDAHTFIQSGVYAVFSQARSEVDTSLISAWSEPLAVRVGESVTVPYVYGDSSVKAQENGSYFTGGSICTNGDPVEYRFDWGDTTFSDWLPVNDTGIIDTFIQANHAWSNEAIFGVRVMARSKLDTALLSSWSSPFYVHVYDSISDTSSIMIPRVPIGPDSIPQNYQAEYMTGGSHIWPVYDAEYRFDWGNGTYSSWSTDTTVSYSWSKGGVYFIRSQARKLNNPSIISAWSDVFLVTVSADSTSTDTVTTPQTPAGLTIVQSNTPYLYESGGSIFLTNDSIARTVEYRFSWGDGSMSAWSTDSTALHAWDIHYIRTLDDSIYVRAQARSAIYTWVVSTWSEPLLVSVIDTINDSVSVSTPGVIGPEIMPVNHTSFFRPTGSVCSNGDPVEYRFIWDDSTFSTWHMFSDTALPEEHSWSSIGSYSVRAQARSAVNNNYISDWSPPLTVPVEASVQDTVDPVLDRKGPENISLSVGSVYTEYGVTGWDNVDGDMTYFVSIEGTVNTSTVGTYTLIYKLSDSSGNQVQAMRTVSVGK